MMRRLIWTVLISSAMLLSGCSAISSMLAGDPGVTDREVQKIKPHPARDVTIVKTLDQYGYDDDATYQTRYWYCKQKKTQLQCRPACGKKTMCPDRGSSIRASLAPRASMLKDQSSQASKPASDQSGSTKADTSGPAGAADEMTDTDNKPSGDKSGKSKSEDSGDKSGSSKSKDKGGDQ